MGTVGFYVSEGGMSAELHGVGAMGPGFDYVSPSTFKQDMMLMDIQTYNTTLQVACCH